MQVFKSAGSYPFPDFFMGFRKSGERYFNSVSGISLSFEQKSCGYVFEHPAVHPGFSDRKQR